MPTRVYLAITEDDFEDSPDVRKYFEAQDIVVEKYMKNLHVLKLRTRRDLEGVVLKFVRHVELESKMSALEEE